MSKYDLSQVTSSAEKIVEDSKTSGGSSGIPLFYLKNGTASLRVLFNPKAGLVLRKTSRHRVSGQYHVCLSNYNGDCPICAAISDAESVSGIDLWKLKSDNRCVFYAQYVKSDYQFPNPKYPEPEVGAIVLVVAPWTVYVEMSKILVEAGSRAPEIIVNNDGKLVNFRRDNDNNRVSYSVALDPWGNSYKSTSSQEEFEALLDNLPDLNEALVPRVISDEIIHKATEVSTIIRSEYLNHRTVTPQQGSNLQDLATGYSESIGQPQQHQSNPYNQPLQQPQSFGSPTPTNTPTNNHQYPQISSNVNKAESDLMSGVASPQQPQQEDQPPTTIVNPVTGQVSELVNGQYVPTDKFVETEFNKGNQ